MVSALARNLTINIISFLVRKAKKKKQWENRGTRNMAKRDSQGGRRKQGDGGEKGKETLDNDKE